MSDKTYQAKFTVDYVFYGDGNEHARYITPKLADACQRVMKSFELLNIDLSIARNGTRVKKKKIPKPMYKGKVELSYRCDLDHVEMGTMGDRLLRDGVARFIIPCLETDESFVVSEHYASFMNDFLANATSEEKSAVRKRIVGDIRRPTHVPG